MSDVPILDDAYFERRAKRLAWEANLRYMGHFVDSFHSQDDTAESLREQYALGKIDLETFKRRLDRVLR